MNINKLLLGSNFNYQFSEVKLRIGYIILSFLITFLTCYYYYFEIIYIFSKPFLNYEKNFIFTDLTEAFYTSIQISYFFSLYLISPLFIYQLWCFFIPSRFQNERKNVKFTFFFIFICLLLSVLVVYFIILPKLYKFLLTFQIKTSLVTIELEARIKSYVELACKIFILFTIIFILPIVVLVSMKTNKLKIHALPKNRLKIFFCILIVSSIISPPDVFTQIGVSFFFQFVFETLLFLGFFLQKIHIEKK